jgi:hypothetical protein
LILRHNSGLADYAVSAYIMGRAPSNFRQQDVTRTINAAKRAGLEIARVEVDARTAKIVVIVAEHECKQDENYWNSATMAPIGKRKRK